ncbi:MAG: hypothetical protein L3J93_02770 [Thermoplasmata archaeon]|nr:hypothetical protein [Thermoplasmata archaeon]
MDGSGGMGGVPSSRLSRLLQEKADALRKRRQGADRAVEVADTKIRQLSEIGIELPESAERMAKVRDGQRKSDWDGVEALAKELSQYLDQESGPLLESHRREALERYEVLASAGITLPSAAERIAEFRAEPKSQDVGAAIESLAGFAEFLRRGEQEFASGLRSQAVEVARWAKEPENRVKALERYLAELLGQIEQGTQIDLAARLREDLPRDLPQAVQLRAKAREAGEAVLAVCREVGLVVRSLEEAMAADESALPTRWSETVPAIDRAREEVSEELRHRVHDQLTGLVGTLESLREHGADPSEAIADLAGLIERETTASPEEIGTLFRQAREVTERPVVAVVADLLDEVRPRLVEARQLGRDPSEVFASMNRAREALRLKIFGEALAASVEAVDRVSRLTGDLDGARDEAESLESLLERLEAMQVPSEPFRRSLQQAKREIERFEVERARATLRDTVRAVGRETARHFRAELTSLQGSVDLAKARGFLPPEMETELAEVGHQLESGSLATAGETLGQLDARLRAAAGPYVARRVEEMEAALAELPDRERSDPTRRSLADADVALRVKDDFALAFESLSQAEKEFAAVFSSEATDLLEALEEHQHLLDEMGGTGAEFQQQIDGVQQIFDMGDFVKATKAAREILSRTGERETERGEEAVSHAKLALVELEKLGLGTAPLRTRFDTSVAALKEGRIVEAYQAATAIESEGSQLRARAQNIATRLDSEAERLDTLGHDGVDVAPLQSQIEPIRKFYRTLDFAAAEDRVTRLAAAVDALSQQVEIDRSSTETEDLLVDAQEFGVTTEATETELREGRSKLAAGDRAGGIALLRKAHSEILRSLRPVLEENLKLIEQDFEIARGAGVDLAPVSVILMDARRRLARPVPIGAAEQIESARTHLTETRGFLEQAELGARRAQDAASEADLLNLMTPAFRARLESVEKALSARAHGRVLELAGPLERELHQTTNHHVSRTLAGLQGLLVRAREDGSVTAAADNLLSQGREALQQGRPMEALQLAARSEGEIERLGLQTRLARGAFSTLEARLERSHVEGIRLPKATELMNEARAALERKEYPRVFEIAFDASESIADARDFYRKARDALEIADRQIKEAMELGADLVEVIAILEQARKASQAGQYGIAAAKARESVELSRWAVERLYAGSLASVRSLLGQVESSGAPEGTDVSAHLAEAEAFLQGKAWREAGQALDRARSRAIAVLDRRVDERLAPLRKARKPGETGTAAEGSGSSAWSARLAEARDAHDYRKAFSILDDAEKELGAAERTRTERQLAELKERLFVGERLGLDTTPAMVEFSGGRIALDQGALEEAAQHIGKGNAALVEMLRNKLASRTKEVETELGFARTGLRIALGALPERMDELRRAAEKNQFVEAARLLLAAEDELNLRKSQHRELLNLHYLVDAALDRAAARTIDTTEARTLLEESQIGRTGDYLEAIAKARSALKLLEGVLKQSEPPTAFWPFRQMPGSGEK